MKNSFLVFSIFFLLPLIGISQTTIFSQLPNYRFATTYSIDSGFCVQNILQLQYIGTVRPNNIINGSNFSYRQNPESIGIQFSNIYSTNHHEWEGPFVGNISYQLLSFSKSIKVKSFRFSAAMAFTRKELLNNHNVKLGIDFSTSVSYKSHYLAISRINARTNYREGTFPFLDDPNALNFQYIFTKEYKNWIVKPFINLNLNLATFSTFFGVGIQYKKLLIGMYQLANYSSVHKIGWNFGQFSALIGREGMLLSQLAIVHPQAFQIQFIYHGKATKSSIHF